MSEIGGLIGAAFLMGIAAIVILGAFLAGAVVAVGIFYLPVMLIDWVATKFLTTRENHE